MGEGGTPSMSFIGVGSGDPEIYAHYWRKREQQYFSIPVIERMISKKEVAT